MHVHPSRAIVVRLRDEPGISLVTRSGSMLVAGRQFSVDPCREQVESCWFR